MEEINLFIDGFNLYHSLIQNVKDNKNNIINFSKYKWLNLYSLANNLIKKQTQSISNIYFFTAFHWHDYQGKITRHATYIEALEDCGVKIVYGKFKEKTQTCKKCGKSYIGHEEKQTDVNIALYLLQAAYKNQFERAMILSGDSDLVPALESIKREFPNKKLTLIIPPFRRADELKNIADDTIKINENHLKNNQFPPSFIGKNGKQIIKPSSW